VAVPKTADQLIMEFMTTAYLMIVATMTPLLLWRGKQLAALALASWYSCYVFGNVLSSLPLDGILGVYCIAAGNVFFTLARVAFYSVTEFLVSEAIPRTVKIVSRVLFIALLLAGAMQQIGTPIRFALQGDALYSLPVFTLPFSLTYIVPIAMLFFAALRAPQKSRVKLGWFAVCGMILLATVTSINAVPFGYFTVNVLGNLGFTITQVGMAFALLHHRLVNISIVIDRTLVYGAMTGLVVGVVAALNSLAIKEALGQGAGLMLQIVVPLALGIVLGRVRTLLDLVVERVFFRNKYLAERSLRRFAKSAGQFQDVPHLLAAATEEISRATASPAVALYVPSGDTYVKVFSTGAAYYPDLANANDLALTIARAELQPVELAEVNSVLGGNGILIPLVVLGVERGVIICADRPGQVYARDEKVLLADVASQIGAAYRILKARENDALVDALASGAVKTLKAARERAQALKLMPVSS